MEDKDYQLPPPVEVILNSTVEGESEQEKDERVQKEILYTINKTMMESCADPDKHHWTNPNSLLHKDWVDRINQYNRVRFSDSIGRQDPLTDMKEQVLLKHQQDQGQRIREAESTLRGLVAYGYSEPPGGIPEDITAPEVQALKTELCAVKGQWDVVDAEMDRLIHSYGVLPPKVSQALDDYRQTPASKKYIKLDHARTVLAWAMRDGRSRQGLPPR